jgi:hypothetical protein
MPTPLELRLHQLSIDFARRVAGIVSELTIEELAALCGEGEVPAPKTRRKKARPVPRPRPAPKRNGPWTTMDRMDSNGQREPEGPSIPSMSIRHSPQGDGGPSISSTPPAPAPPPC